MWFVLEVLEFRVYGFKFKVQGSDRLRITMNLCTLLHHHYYGSSKIYVIRLLSAVGLCGAECYDLSECIKMHHNAQRTNIIRGGLLDGASP